MTDPISTHFRFQSVRGLQAGLGALSGDGYVLRVKVLSDQVAFERGQLLRVLDVDRIAGELLVWVVPDEQFEKPAP